MLGALAAQSRGRGLAAGGTVTDMVEQCGCKVCCMLVFASADNSKAS